MSPPQNKRILLVEDDDVVREIAEETLREAGFGVISVPDGLDALATLPQAQPDLIVSDVRMPRCDGFELLQRVRRHPEYSLIPFVIVSAKADTADQRMGMSLGADDYVTKPYDPADLIKTIQVRLERLGAVNELLRQQRRFLTRTLPHELRTPLTGIIGYADLISQAGEAGETLPPEDLREFGRNLMRSGNRLLRMAEDFSLWAWLESQHDLRERGERLEVFEFTMEREKVHLLARDVAMTYGRAGEFALGVAPEAVTSPLEGFDQVLRHLIDNAFKFSLPGTLVEISGRTNEGFYELVVRDHGRGMSIEQIARIGVMKQFNRETLEQQGLGMGLVLARNFAKLAGGSLSIDPNGYQGGVSVRLVLPLAAPPDQAAR